MNQAKGSVLSSRPTDFLRVLSVSVVKWFSADLSPLRHGEHKRVVKYNLRPGHYCAKIKDQSPKTKDHRPYTDTAIASVNISSATSTFSLVNISGGDQRIVFAPAPRTIKPRSKQAVSTRSRNSGAAFKETRSSTNSTPSISPMPRTSPMQSYFFWSLSRPAFK